MKQSCHMKCGKGMKDFLRFDVAVLLFYWSVHGALVQIPLNVVRLDLVLVHSTFPISYF